MFKFVSFKRHHFEQPDDYINDDQHHYFSKPKSKLLMKNPISNTIIIPTSTITTTKSQTKFNILANQSIRPKETITDSCCCCCCCDVPGMGGACPTGRYTRSCRDSGCTARTSCCPTTTCSASTTGPVSCPAILHPGCCISSACWRCRSSISSPILPDTKRFCALRQYLQRVSSESCNGSCCCPPAKGSSGSLLSCGLSSSSSPSSASSCKV